MYFYLTTISMRSQFFLFLVFNHNVWSINVYISTNDKDPPSQKKRIVTSWFSMTGSGRYSYHHTTVQHVVHNNIEQYIHWKICQSYVSFLYFFSFRIGQPDTKWSIVLTCNSDKLYYHHYHDYYTACIR